MKALSLWQPWATLIAIGAKKIETRSWQTTYRGALAIHASQKMTREMKLLCEREPFAGALENVFAAGDELPLGAIVAVCELVECMSTNFILPPGRIEGLARLGWDLSDTERAFGDYSTNRYAWQLANVRRLEIPIPCRGAQGLFDVPRDVRAQIEGNPW